MKTRYFWLKANRGSYVELSWNDYRKMVKKATKNMNKKFIVMDGTSLSIYQFAGEYEGHGVVVSRKALSSILRERLK